MGLGLKPTLDIIYHTDNIVCPNRPRLKESRKALFYLSGPVAFITCATGPLILSIGRITKFPGAFLCKLTTKIFPKMMLNCLTIIN